MSRQLLKGNQIEGIHYETMREDMEALIAQVQSFRAPVKTAANLPPMGMKDGDLIFVLDEDIFYFWDAPQNVWIPMRNKRTERVRKEIELVNSVNTDIYTGILYGSAGNVTDLESVAIEVNGMDQIKNRDYLVTVDYNEPQQVVITWISPDFPLEASDVVSITYDVSIYD